MPGRGTQNAFFASSACSSALLAKLLRRREIRYGSQRYEYKDMVTGGTTSRTELRCPLISEQGPVMKWGYLLASPVADQGGGCRREEPEVNGE